MISLAEVKPRTSQLTGTSIVARTSTLFGQITRKPFAMKIFVAGATGRVAQALIQELVSAGHHVFAGARNPAAIPATSNVTPVAFDLTASAEQLSKIISDVDAIYFTAGSRGTNLLQVDAFGAVKLMQAAELAGVSRFILLSSVFATQPERWSDPSLAGIMNYNIAKFFADQWLIRNTSLDYTIIQPGRLVEASNATGLIQTDVTFAQPNSIPNVARVLAAVLERRNTFGKVITMADGSIPIDQALEAV